MSKYIFGLAVLLWSSTAVAQHSLKVIVQDEESKEPLIGVNLYIPALKIGGTTDADGAAMISGIPDGKYTIRLSYVGYESVAIERTFPLDEPSLALIITLHHGHEEMEEVVITSTRSSRTIEDIPTRVEFIAGEELGEKANMKPGEIRMLLSESTGIQTQQTSATSYNSSIRIQGLDGKYTQLLRDGLPLYSGFSGGLSIMQVAPLDLKQVEVIKGASSTLYGGGAIAGLVNLISKTPEEEPELSFLLNGTSALGLDVSGFYAEKYGKAGATVFASYSKGTAYDPSDLGLTAIPAFDRITISPRLFLYPSDHTQLNIGVNYITEDRLGGNLDYVKGKTVENPYYERNKTDRISTQMSLQHQFSEHTHLEIKNSFNLYDRSIEIPNFNFEGRQFSSFSEANISTANEKSEWVAGINLWTDRFDQMKGSPGQVLDFNLITFGAFVQNTWSFAEQWSLETGFRGDYQTEYGFFPLPRLSLLFEPTETLTFRLGGGLGYKTPTVFSEDTERIQFQNLLPIDAANVEAERSYGGNFDINHRWVIGEEIALSTNTLLFYTQINNPLLLTTVDESLAFEQSDGFADTKGVEVNLKFRMHDFKLFVGYTYADVHHHDDANKANLPLVAKHRLNNVLMYEKHENIRIGLEAYYFSPQKLSDGQTGKSYWILGFMAEKQLGERFSIFVNFENFLDARQTAFDTIHNGSINNPQFRDIYAPVDGFVVNGGVKFRL